MRTLALGSAVAFVVACGTPDTKTLPPLGQIVLYIDTDAPLPAAPGDQLADTDPPALFDRARIDVYRPGERAPCSGCTHDFAVDRTLVGSGGASVGISPPVGVTGYVARVRLFRSATAEAGEPRNDSAIDVFAALPAISDEGLVEVNVMLRTDATATSTGSLDAPVAVGRGRATSGSVGTWPGARYTPCTITPTGDRRCVPGGAFWMGSVTTFASSVVDNPLPVVYRLVSLSPFILDTREVTVPELRAANLGLFDVIVNSDLAECNFTPEAGVNERLAVNCVDWEIASLYCRSLGIDLPTEAQFEYAASARRGATFVWGEDDPVCADAVFQGFDCTTSPSRPAAAGTGLRDRLSVPNGEIVDLAGNVREWVRDVWSEPGTGCWLPGVAHDPICDQGDLPDERVFRGGGYDGAASELAAATRRHKPKTFKYASVGIRCVTPGN